MYYNNATQCPVSMIVATITSSSIHCVSFVSANFYLCQPNTTVSQCPTVVHCALAFKLRTRMTRAFIYNFPSLKSYLQNIRYNVRTTV